MAERVNPPPSVTFPQRNPFKQGSPEWTFVSQLINGLNSQRIIIEQLFRRSGGGTDTISETGIRETFAWTVPEADNDDVNSLFSSTEQAPSFNAITKAVDYTLASFDYVNFTGNATATFPANPGENDEIIIRKSGGSKVGLNGNGKNMNGSSTGSLYKNGTSIKFKYFIDTDEWFAI